MNVRPKDLKSLFDVKGEQPKISQGIFYLPRRFSDHKNFPFPRWESEMWFGNSNPVCLEFCSGNGDWIAEKALMNKEKNWVAVEMRFDRMQKIWAKMRKYNLSNLVGICAEALTFSRFYLPESSIDEVYVNFPDPWPKRRHEKHRLMRSGFLNEVGRILKGNKLLTFVTDDGEYLKFTLKNLLANDHFKPYFSHPHYATEFENYGSSWFEDLWREKGKEIYYTQFEKVL